MRTVLEIHLVVAFLLVLCALIFSWNEKGRRVVNAVAVLQFLAGLAVAGMMGAAHQPLPAAIWIHLLIAIAIMGCYGMAMRFGKRAGSARLATALSVAGVVLVLLNVYLGWQMAGGVSQL